MARNHFAELKAMYSGRVATLSDVQFVRCNDGVLSVNYLGEEMISFNGKTQIVRTFEIVGLDPDTNHADSFILYSTVFPFETKKGLYEKAYQLLLQYRYFEEYPCDSNYDIDYVETAKARVELQYRTFATIINTKYSMKEYLKYVKEEDEKG